MTMPRHPPSPLPQVAALTPYVPGRPSPSEAGSLASNESPFGASPAVQAALTGAAARIHRYPDPLAAELCTELARLHGVEPDNVLVANGSDEVIYLLVMAYAAGGCAVCADPPYRLDDIVPQIMGASVVKVPLKDWAHDLEAMAAVEADIAFVVNPHNPTGTTVSPESLRRFAERSPARLVVVDEAYIDFADDPAAASMVRETGGNVVVMRTFSKAYGLAGARVGYLVGATEVIDALRKIRPPFSVSSPTQAAALAALADTEHLAFVREQTRLGRERLREAFTAAGYEVVPSQANFVLVVAPDAEELAARLERGGVSVRLGANLDLPGTVRVTVASDEGFALLEAALRA
jgi:histidinol-phosphate aminotransferase